MQLHINDSSKVVFIKDKNPVRFLFTFLDGDKENIDYMIANKNYFRQYEIFLYVYDLSKHNNFQIVQRYMHSIQ